ncbi:unnamed protein product [Oreochromis niloticus]|nr:unnamed protein product [Mustela putorius furo]
MSLNSSSVTNDLLDYDSSSVIRYISIIFSALKVILLFILSTLVLYVGYQQWRKQRSFKTASHSDIFTYHVIVMEFIGILGCICSISSSYVNQTIASIASFITFYGETLFHVLTCVERYLAVVHPVIYMGLRKSQGIRIRNISIGCIWLLCFVLTSLSFTLTNNSQSFLLLCILALSIIIISFCSFSVFCVLIRPGPGEGGRENVQSDQSKQRAFQTFTVVTCTVWLSFAGLLVSNAVYWSPQVSETVRSAVGVGAYMFYLPSCSVLPLLYLHRAGKL